MQFLKNSAESKVCRVRPVETLFPRKGCSPRQRRTEQGYPLPDPPKILTVSPPKLALAPRAPLSSPLFPHLESDGRPAEVVRVSLHRCSKLLMPEEAAHNTCLRPIC